MNTRMAWKLARRELRGGIRGFRIFLACLALGVAAIAAVGTVRASIEAGLAREGKTLLGGDAEMEFTYRFATDEEKAWITENSTAFSEIVDFRSMVAVDRNGTTERGLTQVKAIDHAYPLVGAVQLDPAMSLDDALTGNGTLPGAVMERLLVDRMGLAPGDTFKLGLQEFVLSAAVTRIPDAAAGGFSLGPRTIVRTEALAGSGLIGPGSLYETEYKLLLKEGADLIAVAQEASDLFDSAGLRWTDSRNGAPGIARFVERLGAFLVLVGLSGLAVGGVGVSAAVRAYIGGKTTVIAILRTVGADRGTVFLTYFFQVAVLSVIGIVIGLALGALVPVALGPIIEAQLPIPAAFGIYPAPLGEAALYGLLTALLFTLWPLARTQEVRAAALIRDALGGAPALPAAPFVIASMIALALLIGAAGLFSGQWQLTLWTAAGLSGALVLLAASAVLIRLAARRSVRLARGRPALRWALGAIGGPREGAASVVLSLGLGLSVLAAVGQIDGNLRNAISGDLPEVAPSYFFVDIQQSQIDGFRERVVNDPAVSRMDSAPMLRGVVTQINNRPAREVAGGHWVVEGDRGITYAAAKPKGTRVVAGDWWAEDYSGPPLISFAREEAEEMGIGIGDTLTVNILGRDITATIASLRDVDFSNAGMGFVMTMNPAAVAGAPHTFIATVYAEEQAEAAILRDLANAYPNITAIRVRDAIDRASEVLAGIAAATSYGAAATLLTGFLVLIGAAAAGEGARTYEAAVLKTLGAARSRIMASFALRSIMLGTAAGIVALAAGIAGGWAVSNFVMSTDFDIIWPSAIGIVAGGVLATLLAGLAFAWRPLAARPAQVLRARD